MAKAIKSILVIENSEYWAESIVSALSKKGYKPHWFVRGRRTKDGIVLTAMGGTETLLDVSQFDVALVDGRLDQFSDQGPELTPAIVALGLPVIGISGAPSLNEAMVEGGASGSYLKHDIFTDLASGKLKLETLMHASA